MSIHMSVGVGVEEEEEEEEVSAVAVAEPLVVVAAMVEVVEEVEAVEEEAERKDELVGLRDFNGIPLRISTLLLLMPRELCWSVSSVW